MCDDEKPVRHAQLSRDAAPFVPSYMRNATTTAGASSTPAQSLTTSNAESATPDTAGSAVSSWGQFISAMQEVEIEMLIDMMPAEVQMAYNEALHRANKAGSAQRDAQDSAKGGNDTAPSTEERRRRAVQAATSTFSELTDDQLFFLEEFLHDGDADSAGAGAADRLEALLEGAVGGDTFGIGEEDMNSEEEEWLLEQMMGPVNTAPSGKPQAQVRKPAKRAKRTKK